MSRKRFISVTVLLLILTASGCNLPRREQAAATPDLVATQVATILVGIPTADLQATLTPQPPSPTPTALPTATATAPASDPRSLLGEPAYRDTFEKKSAWGLDDPYDDGHTRVEIKDNRLVLTSTNAEGWMGWRTTYPKPGNAYIESVMTTGECSGGDQYGLVFRSKEDSTAAFFAVTCDGRFSLVFYDGGEFTRPLDWQPGSALLTGSNQTNRLGVWVEGTRIRLYANGSLLAETTVDRLPAQGTFGALIAGLKTTSFTVSVSELAYWELP